MAKDKQAKKDAAQEMKGARLELDAVAERDRRTGNREETPEYWAAMDRVVAAERRVPWWRR